MLMKCIAKTFLMFIFSVLSELNIQILNNELNYYLSFSILVEAEGDLVTNWAEGNFSKRAVDKRFDGVSFQEFFPKDSITNNTKRIAFYLPRFQGPNVYLANDLVLKVTTTLTKEDGKTKIDRAKVIGPVNNVMHSLFEECKIYLNDILINDSNENYPYKALIIDLLSYGSDAKYSFLQAQGFIQDTAGNHDNTDQNLGFGQRRKLYRNEGNTEYAGEPVSFMGRLHTDLSSTEAAIIPGVEIRCELTLSSQDFVLQMPASETEKFKLNITNATLYCPVAELSAEMFRKMENTLKTKPTRIYFQRCEVTNKAISANSKTFVSENLFSTTQLPSRLILAILPTSSYLGDKAKSPFNFARKWVYTSDGSGVGGWAWESISGAITGEATTSTTTKTCYLEKISLTLNGRSVDGMECTATETDDVVNFFRMNYMMGYANSRQGCNITRNDFMKGYFLYVADLTTSANAGLEFCTPSVLMGNLRLHLQFSIPTVEELTLLMFSEWPSLITINNRFQVSRSYV